MQDSQSATMWPAPVELRDEHVSLVPTAPDHASRLIEAAADGDMHGLWYTNAPAPDAVPAEIERRLGFLARHEWLPFTILSADGTTALGMTAFLHLEPKARRLEIGGTWLRQSAQRTRVNPAAKRLLLTHAFEQLDCIAVELRTSTFNRQSRTAIEALGAKLDGILRNHFDAYGQPRDTCVYSIISSEWPFVRRHLTWRLERPLPAPC